MAPNPARNVPARLRRRGPVGGQHRHQDERGELCEAGEGGQRAAGRGAGEDEEGGDQQQRDQGVVRVRLQRQRGVGVGGPGEGEDRGQPAAGRAGPDPKREQDQERDRRQVEDDRRGVRRRQVVPGPVPGPDRLEGDVGEVVDRAVGVAGGDVVGEVAVELFAVLDPVGADDAGIADVDRPGVGEVEPDADPDQEQRGDDEPGRGPDRPDALSPSRTPTQSALPRR